MHKAQRQNGKNPLFDSALIHRILKNPVDCGKIAYGRRRTEKVHAPETTIDWLSKTIIFWWTVCRKALYPKNSDMKHR
ncbi:MAG: recombinase family protein [Intestinimonas massiliensis]|uniref:recombinase family protein n=1 Tax=Intestinimonas TaxID=1392389 RepID=UPI00242E41D0|nr:recombinase family protein [Intestinimonas sp.]MCI5564053.1 recombinase family protein [Intestinimonas massiliensis (ex Afouda et al. 2020)]MDY5338998.1 recombinase family protein [Intestinimonas sp.]